MQAVGGRGGWTVIDIHVLLGMRLEMLHFLVPTKLVGWLLHPGPQVPCAGTALPGQGAQHDYPVA